MINNTKLMTHKTGKYNKINLMLQDVLNYFDVFLKFSVSLLGMRFLDEENKKNKAPPFSPRGEEEAFDPLIHSLCECLKTRTFSGGPVSLNACLAPPAGHKSTLRGEKKLGLVLRIITNRKEENVRFYDNVSQSKHQVGGGPAAAAAAGTNKRKDVIIKVIHFRLYGFILFREA